jgi:thiamine-phosphate pyrophosphorylase
MYGLKFTSLDIGLKISDNEYMIELGELYVIIDPEVCKNTAPLSLLESVVGGGVKTIQLRAKKIPDNEMLELAKRMSLFCKEKNVLFIVNDRLDIALASGAGGVHLGQDDLPIDAARKICGLEFIVGISSHNMEEAVLAEKAGADYIGFGAMYPTSSKPDVSNPQGPEKLEEIVKAVNIPVVAIGGIGLSNIGEVGKSGASSAAVISSVSSFSNPLETSRDLILNFRS